MCKYHSDCTQKYPPPPSDTPCDHKQLGSTGRVSYSDRELRGVVKEWKTYVWETLWGNSLQINADRVPTETGLLQPLLEVIMESHATSWASVLTVQQECSFPALRGRLEGKPVPPLQRTGGGGVTAAMSRAATSNPPGPGEALNGLTGSLEELQKIFEQLSPITSRPAHSSLDLEESSGKKTYRCSKNSLTADT
ncbi:hypothetical protein NQZ68_039223 [Dissostichus eleginoides]|nr:hypothetical protein NQZ68_039223 [Dissostichus eleginoides]